MVLKLLRVYDLNEGESSHVACNVNYSYSSLPLLKVIDVIVFMRNTTPIHMAEEEIIGAVSSQVGQFDTVSQLLSSSASLQIAFVVLVIGIVVISLGYYKFSNWVKMQNFYYHRPHLSRFARVAILPFFAIALISSTNIYIQTFELFDNDIERMATLESDQLTPSQTFAKMLNTMNILVIGYTVAHLIPVVLTKREKSVLEKEDYAQWRELRGFKDDTGDIFHKFFKWTAPTQVPEDMSEEEFNERVNTDQGRKYLEEYRTTKGTPIGSYGSLVKDPFEEWKKNERKKYQDYFKRCITGNNQAGKKLKKSQDPGEIYPIDIWREEKRIGGFEDIIPGARPPGNARRKRKDLPKSVSQIIPIGIFIAVIIGVISWWGIDLVVLATATGGLAIGIGFALQETMQNYFAYILIRKDKIFAEGDRVKLDTGYNGYVHKITPRVTYLRHALNESFAIIPTRQLVNTQIINYSKDVKMVPAVVEVGVSYLNNPRQVAAILVKVGRKAMNDVVDNKNRHLVRQVRCPYLDNNKPSCGCDKDMHTDVNQPVVRFNKFNDSSLDFTVWVYVRDYGSQYKVKTDMLMYIYEEFKKNDIKIPWPIRTIYQGDEKKEIQEIDSLNKQRDTIIDKYGLGDINRGDADSGD